MNILDELKSLQGRVAAAKEAAKEAAKKPVIKKAPVQKTTGNVQHQRPVDLGVEPVLQVVSDLLRSADQLAADAPERKLVDAKVAEIFGQNPKVKGEFYARRAEATLRNFTGRDLPERMFNDLKSVGLIEVADMDRFNASKEAKAERRKHVETVKASAGEDEKHDSKGCAECAYPEDVFWTKQVTGPNSRADVYFVVKMGGELGRYGHRVHDALRDWRQRSYETRSSLRQEFEDSGVTKGITLGDVAAGSVPGQVAAASIPGSDPFVKQNRDGRVYKNFGLIFVRQLSDEEMADQKIAAAGVAAIEVKAPEVSKMSFVLKSFAGRIFAYTTVDPMNKPFHGLQYVDDHGRRFPPMDKYRTDLHKILRHALKHSAAKTSQPQAEGSGAEQRVAATPSVVAEVPMDEEPRRERRKDERGGGNMPKSNKGKGNGRPSEKQRGGAKNLTQAALAGELENDD